MSTSIFEVPASKGGNYEVPPAGSHAAALVGLIDLGTHTDKFGDGEPFTARRILLVWELLDEKTTDGNPHYIGRRFTLSVNEKSNLGKLIGGLRGKALAKDEGFDVRTILGKPCLLNVTHEKSTKGNDYASVAGAGPLPKGMKAAKASVKPLQWSFDDGEPIPSESWIPWVHGQSLITVLQESAEWKGRNGQAAQTAPAAAQDGDEISF